MSEEVKKATIAVVKKEGKKITSFCGKNAEANAKKAAVKKDGK